MLHFFLTVSVVLAQNGVETSRTFGLLQHRRGHFDFVPYTKKERKQVAQTVLNLMQIYVNRKSKVDNYGKGVDPLPNAQALLAKAESLRNHEFHYQMLNIFTPLRDRHTLYHLPGPHRCLNNIQAVSFTITGNGEYEKIIAHKYTEFDKVKELSPQYKDVTLGDELLLVDNEPIQKYIENRIAVSGGANEYGGKRKVLERMSIRSGSTEFPPAENETKYVFKRLKDGSTYTITLPWVTSSDDECYIPAKKALDFKKAYPLGTLFPVPQLGEVVDVRKRFRLSAFRNRPDFLEMTKMDDMIDYGIYQPKGKNIGIVSLKTFEPRNIGMNDIIELLTGRLKDTNAILFDVRGNAGGFLSLAEMIPQIFKKPIQPLSGKVLNNRLNRILLNNRMFSERHWTNAINTTPQTPRIPFTNPAQFTSTFNANFFAQKGYNKPVAILINGDCYSSCEVFAASFQDNKVGSVFGEDDKTGGGGASIVNMDFLSQLDPIHFPPLPYHNTLLKMARPDITVAWRQLIRVNENTFEDIGITPRQMIRPTQIDFVKGTSTYSVYDKIADILAQDPPRQP